MFTHMYILHMDYLVPSSFLVLGAYTLIHVYLPGQASVTCIIMVQTN